jgi:collagenase-like PrtC family protease
MIIYEGDDGTHILTGYSLNLLDELPSLVKANVDTIRIDTFLHETE